MVTNALQRAAEVEVQLRRSIEESRVDESNHRVDQTRLSDHSLVGILPGGEVRRSHRCADDPHARA